MPFFINKQLIEVMFIQTRSTPPFGILSHKNINNVITICFYLTFYALFNFSILVYTVLCFCNSLSSSIQKDKVLTYAFILD